MATLPYDYEVEYIACSAANSKLNFGFRMKYGRGFGVKFSDLAYTGSGWGAFFGTSHTTTRALWYKQPSGLDIQLDWKNSSTGRHSIATASTHILDIKPITSGHSAVVSDDVYKALVASFEPTGTASDDICFNPNQSTFTCKLRGAWVYETDGTVIMNAIPVSKNGVGCMFDTINGVLIEGTGTAFTTGSRIDPTYNPDPKKYLSLTNLTYLWTKIKAVFAPKTEINNIEGNYYST